MAQTFKCGGTTPVEVTDEHRKLALAVRSLIETQVGYEFPEYNLEGVLTQVVAGTNYFLALRISDDDEYVHARIHKPLPHVGSDLVCHSVRTGKTSQDPLEYF